MKERWYIKIGMSFTKKKYVVSNLLEHNIVLEKEIILYKSFTLLFDKFGIDTTYALILKHRCFTIDDTLYIVTVCS